MVSINTQQKDIYALKKIHTTHLRLNYMFLTSQIDINFNKTLGLNLYHSVIQIFSPLRVWIRTLVKLMNCRYRNYLSNAYLITSNGALYWKLWQKQQQPRFWNFNFQITLLRRSIFTTQNHLDSDERQNYKVVVHSNRFNLKKRWPQTDNKRRFYSHLKLPGQNATKIATNFISCQP